MPIENRGKPALTLQQVAEAMTLISAHSLQVIGNPSPLPRDALMRYWSCAHARLKDCRRTVRAYHDRCRTASPLERHLLWDQADSAVREVFISDLLCRTWGAILVACDQSRGIHDSEPIARHVLLRQMEVRQEVLLLMIEGQGIPMDRILQLDRIRRRLERWTDLVLGHLLKRFDLKDFAFDEQRALDFGREQMEAWNTNQHDRMWQLYLLCIRGGFAEQSVPMERHGQLRLESLRAMLACFTEDAFRDEGPLKTPWLARLTRSLALREGPPAVAGLLHALGRRN